MLQNGDDFPHLSFLCVGGGAIRLPTDLAGSFAVVLFYRGASSATCNAQLYAYAKAADELAAEDIKVVSISADDREKAEDLVERLGLGFPVGYAADPSAVSMVTGAFVNEDGVSLDAAGFILSPRGQIETAVYTSVDLAEDRIATVTYSNEIVGRLMPSDALRLVRHLKTTPRN